MWCRRCVVVSGEWWVMLLLRHSCSATSSALYRRHLHVGVCFCLASKPGPLLASQSVSHCYAVLNVSATSSTDELRDAYLHLVKKYHPDSMSGHADADKFAQVEDAYRQILVSSVRLYCVHFLLYTPWHICNIEPVDSIQDKAIKTMVWYCLMWLIVSH